MKSIKLKLLTEYFKSVKDGSKPFEIRKNDRDYQVGDTLLLREWQEKILLETSCYTYKKADYTGQEITKEITYILDGGQYGLEEGYCILGLKQEGIFLKNIDLTGITKREQARKVQEEQIEFTDAFNIFIYDKTEEDKINVMDELLDEFQAKLGLIEKEGIKAEEVQAYYNIWIKKLENRPRIKECKKCIIKADCKLWHSEHWIGEKEAETCKKYKEKEE